MSYRYIFHTACILILMGIVSEARAQDHYADHVLDSLLRELNVAKDDTNKTKLYYKIAERYGQHDPSLYAKYVHIGKAHAEKHKFNRAAAVFVSMLGVIKHGQGDIDSSLWYYQKAYEMHKKDGEERNMALTLVDISSVYDWKGDNVTAIKYLTQAVPLLEKIKDYENLIVTYGNFATIYIHEENYKKALEYELKALKSANIGKVEHKYADIYITLSSIYAGLKDTVKATDFTQKAIPFAQRHHRNYELARAYRQLADYSDDHQQAITYLYDANKIWKRISPEHPIATSVMGSIGERYLKRAIEGKKEINGVPLASPTLRTTWLDEAERYIDTALTLSKKNAYTKNIMYYTGIMAELKAEKGDYKQAYFDFTDHLALYDSLYSQENKNTISQIESENELLIRDQKIIEKENRIREMWLFGILALVSIVLFFLFFLYRNKIRTLQLKNSLVRQEAKQREAELTLQNRIMESELKVMRTQMNPHFIFNVLNSIESYVLENDKRTASRLIQKFAKLSRLVLENSIQNLVPISRDWNALQLYVELESIRFDKQFIYDFYIDEKVDTDRWLIAPMLLQPLVENAIHHGLMPSQNAEKQLKTSLTQENGHLVFSVTDNGVGFATQKKAESVVSYKKKSIGLESIRERLELFNLQEPTHRATLVILSREDIGQGTTVQLIFPVLQEQHDTPRTIA